ncbi:MAG: hypothetical protein IJX80_05020 [Clostridia bacterium]|nr:hypothetical protein [Clostridia bacterium]
MNTDLKALAERLGIAEYPEELEPVFEKMQGLLSFSQITDTLTYLHEEYAPFGEYYDFLLRGAEALQHDEALLTWFSLGVTYCQDATEKEATRFPIPPSDETLARDAFSALLIAMEFPETVKRYRARGFDEAQIKKNLDNLAHDIHVNVITKGKVALAHYGWLIHYTKAHIFDDMGFNFQPWKWSDEAILLKNRQSGEYAFLMLKGKFTAQGTVAGIRGKEDEPAIFEAALEETDDAFIGYRAIGQQQRVSVTRETFRKSEWEAVLRPGDDVINFHIPRGADLSPAYVEACIARGAELMKKYYPECKFNYTVCTSWMLDPKLLDVLPVGSKISQFIRRFVLHPTGDTAGDACMSYVFPGENGAIETLSENTSLQRGIKSMMLGGNFIFWTTGVWM